MQHLKSVFKSAILAIVLLLTAQIDAKAQTNLPEEFQLGICVGDTFNSAIALDASMPFMNEVLRTNVGFEDGLSLSALYEFHDTIVDQFYWYYGFGVQVGFFDDFALAPAVDIGLEYDIYEVPLTAGIDYRFGYDLIAPREDFSFQVSLYVRYRF